MVELVCTFVHVLDITTNHKIAYERIEDVAGMLDCLAMKSRIASWNGDDTTVSQTDEQYMQLLKGTIR